MNIVEQAAVCTKTWTTAEIVYIVQLATYRNATDTADVEAIYRHLGLDFTSNWKSHVPVSEANNE
jgi:hypothetical protein